MAGLFVQLSMVTTGHATGLEKTLLTSSSCKESQYSQLLPGGSSVQFSLVPSLYTHMSSPSVYCVHKSCQTSGHDLFEGMYEGYGMYM